MQSSELFKLKAGYRSSYVEIDDTDEQNKALMNDINKIINQNIYDKKETINVLTEEIQYFESEVALTLKEAENLCFNTRFQNNNLWIQERKKRITASNAYTYFTYARNKNADWDKKILDHLISSFQGNADTKHGLECEKDAVKVYEELTKNKVTKMGLVVNPAVPWLGFTPDGIVMDKVIIEIKSPKIGKSKTADEAVKELPFMECKNGEMILKERHKYFCQVQLGMYVSGLSNCHFIVYSSWDKSIYAIDIPYNKNLVENCY